jgi:hypothetical protein
MTDRQMLALVAQAIDWNVQHGSCYLIGEDAAIAILMQLGNFPWDEGINNESVEKFIKTPIVICESNSESKD